MSFVPDYAARIARILGNGNAVDLEPRIYDYPRTVFRGNTREIELGQLAQKAMDRESTTSTWVREDEVIQRAVQAVMPAATLPDFLETC